MHLLQRPPRTRLWSHLLWKSEFLVTLTKNFLYYHFRYCIKAKSRPTASDNIDMTDFYDDDYDIDDDYDDDEEEDENAEDSEDSGTGKV